MNLILRVKMAYGRRNVYPACKLSILLLGLTGGKVFTSNHLRLIEQLGYVLVYEGGKND